MANDRELAQAARAADAPRFDAEARARQGRVADALLADVDAERLARWNEALGRLVTEEAARQFLEREPQEAGWALARRCRDDATILSRYASEFPFAGSGIARLLAAYVRAHRDRAECPWLAVEAFGAVPAHKRALGDHASSLLAPLGRRAAEAMAVAAFDARVTHRRLLVERLAREGWLGVDRALAGLTDRAVREPCEAALARDVAAVADRLRPLLAAKAAGTREAAVRLLRAVDPDLRLDGTAARGVEEFETRLREAPDDAEASQVWADALCERGDPRGEHVALEHAIRGASDPAAALELSGRQAALFQARAKEIVGRPGGFPFQERYRGRRLIRFVSDWNHRVRGDDPLSHLRRLHAFALAATDALRPRLVTLQPLSWFEADRLLAGPRERVEPASDRERAIARILPGAQMVEVEGRRVFLDDADRERALEEGALEALCAALGQGMVAYRFLFTAEGTRTPLPHQEHGHYPGAFAPPGAMLFSRAALGVGDRRLDLSLHFPFESFEDPGFLRLVDALEETLGKVLTPGRFGQSSPSADATRLIDKKRPFARAQ